MRGAPHDASRQANIVRLLAKIHPDHSIGMLLQAESYKRACLAEVDKIAFITTDADAARRHPHPNRATPLKLRHL